jgi:tRNA (guanine6-N2)-methyltransferase
LPSDLFFARTVHGLEDLAAAELESHGCTILHASKRQLLLRGTPGPARLLDDLFRLLARADDPGRSKAGLASAVNGLRPIANAGPFSLTASFTGPRNYSRYDIEDAVAPIIGGRYLSRRDGQSPPAGTVDFRITLGADGLLIGRRVADRPLHRRQWKVATIPGTLHPPVAAAMARLAGLRPGHLVIDPCCGAGTLLIEAAALCPGAKFRGSDTSAVALAAAATNGSALDWERHDTVRLPYSSGEVDRILVNPPWGVQVPALPAGAQAEWRRVLRPGGLLVALIPSELPLPGWQIVSERPISLAGQHPRIVVARAD